MPKTAFNDNAQKAAPAVLNVLVLGAGIMGQRHIASLLEISDKVLQPQKNVTLDIIAIDKDQAKLDKLPPQVARFTSLDAALAAQKPDIALMAFNDNHHTPAFTQLFAQVPDLKAVLSEKPLTEYLADAKALEPEFRARYLSMNTVINFSPVFDRVNDLLPQYGSLTPLGFEAVWGKNRTADTRPSIGIPSESVHALSVVSDMFGQGALALETGAGKAGYLSVNATDVIYEMETVFRGATGLPMRFHASYVFPQQERRVTAYYSAPEGVLAVEMDFDVKHEGQNKDRLRLHRIDAKTGALETLVDEYPAAIVNGAAPGVLRNDRITAFNALSLLDFLTPEKDRSPELSLRLSNLDAALQIQGEVEQINKDNKRLSLTVADADPATPTAPKLPPLSDTTAADRLARLDALKHFFAKPKPKRSASGPNR